MFALGSIMFGAHSNYSSFLQEEIMQDTSGRSEIPNYNPSIVTIFHGQNWVLHVYIIFLAISFILSDPCVRLNCGQYFGACVLSIYSDPECKCLQDCGYQDNPVCGDDKNTYFSECALMKDTCVREIPNRVRHRGQCSK